MSPGCLRAGVLLERRAAGLSAADALRLEEHLAGCEQCAQEANLLGGLAELSREAPQALEPERRARAITRALATAGSAPAVAPSRWLLPVLAAAAAGALVVVAGNAWLGSEPVVPVVKTPPAVPAPVVRGDQVLAGELLQDGRPLASGATLGSSTFYSARGATVALAHARIELRPGTEVAWDADSRNLRLRAGSVMADVDPTRHASFTVSTAVFSVRVLGTRFEVTPQSVRVEHGRVQVLAPDGEVLVATLSAGERFQFQPATPSAAAAPAPRSREPLRIDVDELLAHARGELAQHHLEQARTAIDQALRSAGGASERAEALSLRAECALVSGDLSEAVETYLRVARRFSRLPAGQNALFAAARVEADRGHKEQAAALLERYLARYPRGHLVSEARSRLHSLGVDVE